MVGDNLPYDGRPRPSRASFAEIDGRGRPSYGKLSLATRLTIIGRPPPPLVGVVPALLRYGTVTQKRGNHRDEPGGVGKLSPATRLRKWSTVTSVCGIGWKPMPRFAKAAVRRTSSPSLTPFGRWAMDRRAIVREVSSTHHF